ncbi:MAG TPA: TlpA disulfide reductase family protein [Solirubrobacteraceae bacterium]|jgi:thiol-disulfide isomerase/thioredoxin|nr:TlpA disulfide reductase family protein [Solirubrobacteraceae bacterium]
MSIRRATLLLACLAVAALVAVGLTQLPKSSPSETFVPMTAGEQATLLSASPSPLAALHRQGGRLLGGGTRAFAARLAALRSYPIVINKWASWCVPCRAEFGAFQRVAARYGRRVAFLGLDSGDSSRAAALAFLRAHPVSYPSYYDPSGALGARVTDSSFTPVTLFVPLRGVPFPRQGQYPSAAKLEEDVLRYALGS